MAETHQHSEPTKQAELRRWSPGETAVLIDAWAPLYRRRRGGQSDVWVPRDQRGRARSFRDLVPEDWRAVAAAVNGYRAEAGLTTDRTPDQCKRRMRRILPTLNDVGADGGVGHGAGAGAAVDRRRGAPRDARGAAAAEAGGGAAPAVAAGDAAPAAAGDARGHAARDLFGGSIPKRPRTGTGSSTSAGAGGAALVKDELVRRARNALDGAADERRGDDARSALRGAAADGVVTTMVTLAAAGSADAAVMMALGQAYKEVTLRRIELEMEKTKTAAADAARGAVA